MNLFYKESKSKNRKNRFLLSVFCFAFFFVFFSGAGRGGGRAGARISKYFYRESIYKKKCIFFSEGEGD